MATPNRAQDEWLALRCQLGEPAAYRELVAELERPLMYFAGKLLGNDRDALDVVQEVWLSAFAKIRQLREPGALRPWLYQLTRSIAASRVRSDVARERREASVGLETLEASEEGADADWLAGDAQRLHAALDQLSLEQREVLTLQFIEDLSIEEIATIVQVPSGTVKSRLFHAKRRLREALEADHEKF
jgi:RNA polymerase sigma-70 factor (ECF subfamily)